MRAIRANMIFCCCVRTPLILARVSRVQIRYFEIFNIISEPVFVVILRKSKTPNQVKDVNIINLCFEKNTVVWSILLRNGTQNWHGKVAKMNVFQEYQVVKNIQFTTICSFPKPNKKIIAMRDSGKTL